MDLLQTKQLATAIRNGADDVWLIEALGGMQRASSGQSVNYNSALTMAYVWACQSIIAGDVASLPLDVKYEEDDGDLIKRKDHPAYRVVNGGNANRNMSALSLRETLTHHALMCGNGMAYIVRDQRENPIELIPARRGALIPKYNGRREVVYHDETHNEVWSQWDILHVKGFGDDGISGLSWLNYARNSIGLGLAENDHGSKHFANGAKPSIVLKTAQKLNKEQADELADRWEDRHAGDSRPAIASGGLQVEDFPVNNSDAQWLESRRFTRQEVAAWFNMPPHKIGDSERTGYNSIIAENQAYVSQTLRRWLKRWEAEVSRKLLRHAEQDTFRYHVIHDANPLIETDTGELIEQVTSLVESKIITYNEARAKLGYPRIAGGDVRENPNTSTSDTESVEPEEETTEEPTELTATDSMQTAIRVALAGRLSNLCHTLSQQTTRRKNKGGLLDSEWVATWQCKAVEYTTPTMNIAAAAPGVSVSGTEAVTSAVGDWTHSIWHDGVAIPSPHDLATQLISDAN